MNNVKSFPPEWNEYDANNCGIQPDWNQNDETAAGYVKNRTHYEEVLGEYVIFEGTLPAYTSTTDLPLQYAIPPNTSASAYYNGRIVATVVGKANNNPLSTWYGFSPDLDLTVNNSTMKASVYNGMGDGVLKFVVENFTLVHTLDEKYLPNNVKGMVNSKMNANNPVGTGSFSMGRKPNTEIGLNSHAEGYITTASGSYSHAEGSGTTASGKYSHAEGSGTTASGECSHAEGFNTTASGNSSHAEGAFTNASGVSSHAEGAFTKAIGDYSHAEGYRTTASGKYSHAEGYFTTASGKYSHAEGEYNIEDVANKYAHIIGNGTSDSNLHNCFMVGWDGAIYVQASDDATKMMKLTIKSDGTISAVQATV